MTHAELVSRGAAWLRNKQRCKAILTETSSGYNAQVPDVIGWDWRGRCLEIECKASIADMRADRTKPHRQPGVMQLGSHRYYLVPASLGIKSVPEGWGLLLATPRRIVEFMAPTENPCRDLAGEAQLLVAVIARYQSQGINYQTLREIHDASLRRMALDRARGFNDPRGVEEAQALMGGLGIRS